MNCANTHGARAMRCCGGLQAAGRTLAMLSLPRPRAARSGTERGCPGQQQARACPELRWTRGCGEPWSKHTPWPRAPKTRRRVSLSYSVILGSPSWVCASSTSPPNCALAFIVRALLFTHLVFYQRYFVKPHLPTTGQVLISDGT